MFVGISVHRLLTIAVLVRSSLIVSHPKHERETALLYGLALDASATPPRFFFHVGFCIHILFGSSAPNNAVFAPFIPSYLIIS